MATSLNNSSTKVTGIKCKGNKLTYRTADNQTGYLIFNHPAKAFIHWIKNNPSKTLNLPKGQESTLISLAFKYDDEFQTLDTFMFNGSF